MVKRVRQKRARSDMGDVLRVKNEKEEKKVFFRHALCKVDTERILINQIIDTLLNDVFSPNLYFKYMYSCIVFLLFGTMTPKASPHLNIS